MSNKQGMTVEAMADYMISCAQRIRDGEDLRIVMSVENHATKQSGLATYGHESIGRVFLQMEDATFNARMQFLLPQMMVTHSTAGSS